MYGANYNTNSGNTVYTWSATTGEMSVNGVGQGASTDQHDLPDDCGMAAASTPTISRTTRPTSRSTSTPANGRRRSAAQLAKLGFSGQVARGNIANAFLYNGNTASLIENAIGGIGQ